MIKFIKSKLLQYLSNDYARLIENDKSRYNSLMSKYLKELDKVDMLMDFTEEVMKYIKSGDIYFFNEQVQYLNFKNKTPILKSIAERTLENGEFYQRVINNAYTLYMHKDQLYEMVFNPTHPKE